MSLIQTLQAEVLSSVCITAWLQWRVRAYYCTIIFFISISYMYSLFSHTLSTEYWNGTPVQSLYGLWGQTIARSCSKHAHAKLKLQAIACTFTAYGTPPRYVTFELLPRGSRVARKFASESMHASGGLERGYETAGSDPLFLTGRRT